MLRGLNHNVKGRSGLSRIIVACLGLLGAMPLAAAQNNPVGNLIGGILNAAVIQAVQAEWDQLPQVHGTCLRSELQKRGMNLTALIQRGIGPFHASLAQIADPCVRLQEEADANLARQRKEEADRAAEARRQEQARIAQEKKTEADRINALRKITLRKNFRCDIVEQALVYNSFCDENLYRKTDGTLKNPMQVLEAINARLSLDDLILDRSETADAMARRKSMMAQFPNAFSVPGTRYECPKMKANRESLVCVSYELAILDGLYYDYLRKGRALEKMAPALAKDFSISLALQTCNLDSVCLKKGYMDGIEAMRLILQNAKVIVPSYEEHIEQLRAEENKHASELAALLKGERDRIESERAMREKQAEEKRELAEARQRDEERLRETERQRLQEEKLAKERAEQEQKRLAEEKLKQEAEALEALKQKWLKASQTLTQDRPKAQLQSCKSGALARKKLNEANDLAQRASIRQAVAQDCSCIVTALMVEEEAQVKTSQALLASFESGDMQAGQDEALKSTQALCQSFLPKEIIEGWKAN